MRILFNRLYDEKTMVAVLAIEPVLLHRPSTHCKSKCWYCYF